MTLKLYLLSVFFIFSLGNSNWFVFTILVFYLYAYLSFRFIESKLFIGIGIISFLCFFHVIIIYNYYYIGKKYAVDNVLCYVIGFYYSLSKTYIDHIILKNDIFYFGFLTIVIFVYYKVSTISSLLHITIKNSLFALLIVFISMKVKINNIFLQFLNIHSYSIYLLQRLVLWIVSRKKIFGDSYFAQISFEFICIFFISSLFDKYTVFIDEFFKRNSKNDKKNKYIPVKIVYLNKTINKN